jgi:TolB protein
MKKLLILTLLIFSNSYALLKIDINKQGMQQIPIAVADFSGENNNLSNIITGNLKHSGHFSIQKLSALSSDNSKDIDFDKFKKNKIEAIVSGSVKRNADNNLEVSFFVYDIWTKKSILSKKITVGKKIIRRVGHIISDKVHFSLLGEEGFFDSLIAYVSFNKHSNLPYKLEVIDSDGKNPQIVMQSKEPIMSPSWSPNNKLISYVSFASGKSRVYIQSVFNNKTFIKLPIFEGLASSPSWHPNGKSLLLTLSKNDNQDIYRYYLNGELERITKHNGIDTEASFSPDGKKIVWTSNRDGNPSIYIKNANSSSAKKLKISGNYNTNPSFSADGKKIILVHSEYGEHKIAEFDLSTNDLVVITDNILDESPSFAPNSKMVIYSSSIHNNSYLSVVSNNGLFGFKLSDGSKKVRDPVWSNFL